MKICFIIYELDYADHIAIAYLSAIARELNCKRYFHFIKGNRKIYEHVLNIKPDIIAYSANISSYKFILEFHNNIRQKYNFVSIMGGPHATFSPHSFQESNMDAYCIGEGEWAFHDFIKCVIQKVSFDNVPNLITKNATNPVRPLIENLDEIPTPDRDLTISNSFLKKAPKKTFYTTRGCPYQCSYCCNNHYHSLYKGKGPKIRKFSVERIIKEIEDVKSKYRMDFLKFGDDVFVMKADEWLAEFVEKYPVRVGVPFNCYLRFDIIDDKILSELKKAGCHSVHLSVDSTSEYVREKILRRQMKKNIDIAKKLLLIRKYKIHTWVNYMIAAPESSLQNDIDTIYLNKTGKVSCPSYSTTVPMRGTDLHEYCVNKKIIGADYDMTGWGKKTVLSCFDEKEKNIRYNIYLLGAFISKLPFPFYKVGIVVIKKIPPNFFFKLIHYYLYKYFYNFKIFRLSRLFKLLYCSHKESFVGRFYKLRRSNMVI